MVTLAFVGVCECDLAIDYTVMLRGAVEIIVISFAV
jgi:hypothetical protein